MATEIERKFLVTDSSWRTEHPTYFCQGYLSRDRHRTVRIRIAGPSAFITIKGSTTGASRAEYEYKIPVSDAEEMLSLCEGPLIKKMRHEVHHDGFTWEIDEFLGDNSGLVVAEVELTSETQQFSIPEFVGEEITDDPRYFNSQLSVLPYNKWNDT